MLGRSVIEGSILFGGILRRGKGREEKGNGKEKRSLGDGLVGYEEVGRPFGVSAS